MLFRFLKNTIYISSAAGMKKCSLQELDRFLLLLSIRARLNYHFSLLFRDEVIEAEILRIACEVPTVNSRSKQFFFEYAIFDSYGWDARGLSEQYIRGLVDAGIEFIYIFDGKEIGQAIKSFLYENSVQIVDLSICNSALQKLEVLRPYHIKEILVHTSPEGVFPFLAKKILGVKKTYLIDITDHDFWAGVDSVDHFLEFRDYGAFILSQGRKPKNELVDIIPYYPITHNDLTVLSGEHTLEIVGQYFFSAGNVNKIIDEKNSFLELVKMLLDELPNHNFIFAFSGNGDFIKKFFGDTYLDRITLLGYVKNIHHYVENADFVLATFPIGGGLVGSYAIENSTPLFSLVHQNSKHSHLKNTFPGINELQQSYNAENLVKIVVDFINGAIDLREDILNAQKLAGSRENFSNVLSGILNGTIKSTTPKLSYPIDVITKHQQKISYEISRLSKVYAKKVLSDIYWNWKLLDFRLVILCACSVMISV